MAYYQDGGVGQTSPKHAGLALKVREIQTDVFDLSTAITGKNRPIFTAKGTDYAYYATDLQYATETPAAASEINIGDDDDPDAFVDAWNTDDGAGGGSGGVAKVAGDTEEVTLVAPADADKALFSAYGKKILREGKTLFWQNSASGGAGQAAALIRLVPLGKH